MAAALTLLLTGAVAPALAHTGVGSVEGFAQGLMHPLTGLDHGPELAALLPLIGREKALKRLAGESA